MRKAVQPPVPGEFAPTFTARTQANPAYVFSSVGGRFVLLLFFGSAASPEAAAALAIVRRNRPLFDDTRAAFFGVTGDPADEGQERIRPEIPGIRFFYDFDRAVARLYGAVSEEQGALEERPFWVLLDPQLRVMVRMPIEAGEQVMALVSKLPEPEHHAGVPLSAPVLILPRVLEGDFCRSLIDLYERVGGRDSGFMREENGKTVGKLDHSFKRRADVQIEDEQLRAAARIRMERRLLPAIKQAFQFDATYLERYIVAR